MIEKTIVPKFSLYEVPQCPHCEAPFVFYESEGKSYETWRQSCLCLPTGNEHIMTRYIPSDNRHWLEVYFQGKNIGQPIIYKCILCMQPMAEGEEAYLGTMGKFSYCGYAHACCYETMLSDMATAEKDAQAAAQGVSIAFWYSLDDLLKPAPSTGHYDGHVRMVPQVLPPFPPGAVVYEKFRRPFAISSVDFPSREDSEAWWKEATANENVALALFWYEPGQKEKASREFVGSDFSRVESAARRAEWDAMQAQGYY